MKFFIDENLPHSLVGPLGVLFREHGFHSCHSEGLTGVQDIPLFQVLSAGGFTAIITKDARQVRANDAERRALHDCGVHWIGVRQPSVGGLKLMAAWVAGLTAAMPHILDRLGQVSTPSWFRVNGIPHEASQRMTSGPLLG
ncbi:hypothetical protein JOF41_004638 [Saccharothrix coeruleofusca]|uniref:PIN-like domain-containing protein n=1 Tax=Saccharothrix coeruleofusca TaxID=33919 RepID=UPI001AE327CF|nr:hypothetical protein [Saccharothrix coeruleofusca]MBP2338460.1 hypothetical protein [Saccharothrix coeruleofusca]